MVAEIATVITAGVRLNVGTKIILRGRKVKLPMKTAAPMEAGLPGLPQGGRKEPVHRIPEGKPR